jgi:hypothetical protein
MSQLNAVTLKILRDMEDHTLTVGDLLRYVRAYRSQRQQKVEEASRQVSLRARRPAGSDHMDFNADGEYGLDLTIPPFVRRLETLSALGLVTLSRKGFLGQHHSRTVRISPNFLELQRELGFSLGDARDKRKDAITVAPVFEKITDMSVDVFVAMPFLPELDYTYEVISDVCAVLEASVTRADELFTVSHVVNDIWSAIFHARAVICDCTGRNPNVFYELGIAHTLGKKVMLIARNEADIPFDLRHWRYFVYSDDRISLENHVKAALTRVLLGQTEVVHPKRRALKESFEVSSERLLRADEIEGLVPRSNDGAIRAKSGGGGTGETR